MQFQSHQRQQYHLLPEESNDIGCSVLLNKDFLAAQFILTTRFLFRLNFSISMFLLLFEIFFKRDRFLIAFLSGLFICG